MIQLTDEQVKKLVHIHQSLNLILYQIAEKDNCPHQPPVHLVVEMDEAWTLIASYKELSKFLDDIGIAQVSKESLGKLT